jgi:alpha-beta hydrolase superfamily lysophospholipase
VSTIACAPTSAVNHRAGHPSPFFLQTKNGRLLCVWHTPLDTPRRAVLHVPAFGEEMHKSRRMVALLAQTLRARGTATLLIDPFGTGDSEGDLEKATWELWKDDFRAAHG